MISFAQNFEDVMIARAFPAGHHGFYVDIGAAHPINLSVTCHFYNAGWSGVNVEPSRRLFPVLAAARPRDINLNCAVAEKSGHATFFEVPGFVENSTLDPEVAARLAESDLALEPFDVPVTTLSALWNEHVGDRTVDFMKIDVEGGEAAVLAGADWTRHRPRLLIIEATAVNSRLENWASWESTVLAAGYQKVWFDGLNNFYLRDEDSDLRSVFRLPPNVFDDFMPAALADARLAIAEVVDGRADIATLAARMNAPHQGVDQVARLESTLAVAIEGKRELDAILAARDAQIMDLLSAVKEEARVKDGLTDTLAERDAELRALQATMSVGLPAVHARIDALRDDLDAERTTRKNAEALLVETAAGARSLSFALEDAVRQRLAAIDALAAATHELDTAKIRIAEITEEGNRNRARLHEIEIEFAALAKQRDIERAYIGITN